MLPLRATLAPLAPLASLHRPARARDWALLAAGNLAAPLVLSTSTRSLSVWPAYSRSSNSRWPMCSGQGPTVWVGRRASVPFTQSPHRRNGLVSQLAASRWMPARMAAVALSDTSAKTWLPRK